MTISLGPFRGMIPRIDPTQLPENAASYAQNVDLRSGSLRPLTVSAFDTLTANQIPEGEWATITKPAVVTRVTPIVKLCRPSTWITSVKAFLWGFYTGTDGLPVDALDTDALEYAMTVEDIEYADYGLRIKASFDSASIAFTAVAGRSYTLVGPVYQFVLTADSGGVYGGPATTITMPATPRLTDPALPGEAPPLFWTNGRQYGSFQVIDVRGPDWRREETFTETTNIPLDSGDVTFTVNLNYVEPTYRSYYFRQTHLDSALLEGPPSDPSALIVVGPGDVLTLNTSATKHNLYRNVPGNDNYYLAAKEHEGTTWSDTGLGVQAVTIPPYGNPQSDASFQTNSLLHPAQFGVSFVTGESTLYMSDPYRLHAWPDENTIEFQEDIVAVQIVGGTIVVFTTANVFAVTGNNPATMSKYLLASDKPLAAAAGLCRIGQTLYYPTRDGLAACTGNGVEIVTASLYTSAEWAAALGTLSAVTAKTADGIVFLEDGTKNLAIHVGEGHVTEFTDTAGSDVTWTSRTYKFDRPVIFDYARVVADAYTSVTLTTTVDGGTPSTTTISDSAHTAIDGAVFGRQWTFSVESASAIHSMQFFERRIFETSGDLTLTPGEVDVWEDVWVKFTDRSEIAAVMVALADQTSGELTIKDRAATALTTITKSTWTDGLVFYPPRTDDLGRLELVRLGLTSPCQPTSMRIFGRQTVRVDGTIREVNTGAGPAPWRVKVYELPDRQMIGSVTVNATKEVTLNYRINGGNWATETVAVTSPEVRLAIGPASTFEYHFGADDADVTEVIVPIRPAITVNGPVTLTGPWGLGSVYLRFPDRGRWGCISVGATANVTGSLSVVGGTSYSLGTLSDGHVHVFPATMVESEWWELSLSCTGVIDQVVLMPLERVATDGDIVEIAQDTGVWPWAWKVYETPDESEFTSAIVKAEAYPVTITVNGVDVVISSAKEHALTTITRASSFRVGFGGTNDYKVNELRLFKKRASGVEIQGPPWRRRFVEFENKGQMVGGVFTGDTTATVTVKGDGVQIYSGTVSPGVPFYIPRSASKAKTYEIDFDSTGEIRSARVFPKVRVQAPLSETANDIGIPSWIGRVYEMPGASYLKSGFVKARSYPIEMFVYTDNAVEPSERITIVDGHEFTFDYLAYSSCVEVRFDDDSLIEEWALFSREVVPVGISGLVIRPGNERLSWRKKLLQFPEQGSFSVARVSASDYSGLSLSLGAVSFSVTSGKDFELSGLTEAHEFELDIERAEDINELVLIGRRRWPVVDGRVVISRDQEPFSWLGHHVITPDALNFNSCLVVCSGAVTLTVKRAGTTLLNAKAVTATTGSFRLPASQRGRLWEVSLSVPNGTIVERVVLATSMSRLIL